MNSGLKISDFLVQSIFADVQQHQELQESEDGGQEEGEESLQEGLQRQSGIGCRQLSND